MKRLTWLALLATTACREDDPAPAQEQARMTYWDDVAPIYFESCVSCHRDGGIAPFRLDTYEDATAWADASALAVAERTMPPWLANEDGTCGSFMHSRALSEDAIDTIVAWADGDAAEGAARDDLAVPTSDGLEGAVSMTTPTFTPEIVGGPLAEFDEYRCFRLDPGADGFITGYEVVPGNDAIVHHVLVFSVDPDGESDTDLNNAQEMQRLDDLSPDRPGWPCFEGAGETVGETGLPVAWAPGQGVVDYPEGTGMAFGDGEVLVAQIHYNLANPDTVGMSDQTEIRLRVEDQVEKPGFMALPDFFLETLFEDEPATLEPGQESVEFTWELPVGFAMLDLGVDALTVYGVLPHMHEYGQRISMTVAGEQEEACAVDVPRWDFDWQLLYFYEEPLPLKSSDVLRITCGYDTRDATAPVLPGWGTRNEMCLMGLFLVPE